MLIRLDRLSLRTELHQKFQALVTELDGICILESETVMQQSNGEIVTAHRSCYIFNLPFGADVTERMRFQMHVWAFIYI